MAFHRINTDIIKAIMASPESANKDKIDYFMVILLQRMDATDEIDEEETDVTRDMIRQAVRFIVQEPDEDSDIFKNGANLLAEITNHPYLHPCIVDDDLARNLCNRQLGHSNPDKIEPYRALAVAIKAVSDCTGGEELLNKYRVRDGVRA
jgi:hypothetical protein